MNDFKPPLLLPKPRWIQSKRGYTELGTGPFPVKGIDPSELAIVNECLRSLPSINPNISKSCSNSKSFWLQDRQPIILPKGRDWELFIPHRPCSTSTNGGSTAPTIVVRLGKGFTPKFSDKGQYNYGISEIRKETYRLTIQNAVKPAIIIDAETSTAVRYALFTLVQLIRQYGSRLPSMVIEDAPAFPNRGVMLDISRDRVPRQDELLKLIDRLASWKINHFQLYTEHTFAYKTHEKVWKDASPMTPDEIKELDKHCIERGITLAANQNCFGHLTRWLKHEKYAHLAEIHGNTDHRCQPSAVDSIPEPCADRTVNRRGLTALIDISKGNDKAGLQGEWDFYGTPRSGPFSLCPTKPDSIALVEDVLTQLLPNFSSGLVNIGCDEVADVGQGKSKEIVEEKGAFTVYWEFVRKVMNIARKNGYRPMYWADMWLKTETDCQPSTVDYFGIRKPCLHGLSQKSGASMACALQSKEFPPDDAISLIWGYEPDAEFERWCKTLKAKERDVWVCPGTSSWRSITGRTRERRSNLSEAAKQGIVGGANGYLITEWGDLGHRQQFPVTLSGLADGANYAWFGEGVIAVSDAASLHVFGDGDINTGTWLGLLGDADSLMRMTAGKPLIIHKRTGEDYNLPQPLKNSSCLFVDLETPFDDLSFMPDINGWLKTQQYLVEIAELPKGNCETLINDELNHTLAVARFAVDRAILRRKPDEITMEKRKELADRMREIIKEHRRLWLLRSRPGGLDDSCRYYGQVIEEIV